MKQDENKYEIVNIEMNRSRKNENSSEEAMKNNK